MSGRRFNPCLMAARAVRDGLARAGVVKRYGAARTRWHRAASRLAVGFTPTVSVVHVQAKPLAPPDGLLGVELGTTQGRHLGAPEPHGGAMTPPAPSTVLASATADALPAPVTRRLHLAFAAVGDVTTAMLVVLGATLGPLCPNSLSDGRRHRAAAGRSPAPIGDPTHG